MKKLLLYGLLTFISYNFGRGVQLCFDKNYYEGWY